MILVVSIGFLIYLYLLFLFFFFKQKTAYELRISDWSSDVCSSDLRTLCRLLRRLARFEQLALRPDRRAPRGEHVDHPRLLSRGKDAKRGAGGNSRALFLAPVMTVRKRLCLGGDPPRGVLYQRAPVGDAPGAVRTNGRAAGWGR